MIAACDVFISYSHADKPIADRLTRSLRDAGFDVFIDDDIAAGESIMSAVDSRVERARAVVVLWSTSSRDSPFVQGEIMAARDCGTLVPVLIDDSPISTFVRSIRFRRLVTEGSWNELGFQELRHDLSARCGKSRASGAPGASMSPDGQRVRRGDSPHPRLSSTHVPHTPAPATAGADLIGRVTAVVENLQAVESMRSDVLGRMVHTARLPPGTTVLAAVDLSLSRMQPCFVALLDDHMLYARSDKVVPLPYTDVVSAPIKLEKDGFGLSARVLVGATSMEVTGSLQVNTVLEVLYGIREEFGWAQPT